MSWRCRKASALYAFVIIGIHKHLPHNGAKGSFRFNIGSLLVLGAACCWGLENNCTRMLSTKSSVQITTIKGTFSGLGSFVIAVAVGEKLPGILWIGAVLLLGFVAYGLILFFNRNI